jgi:hypothetical protein
MKTTKGIYQDNRYPGQDLDRVPLKHESETLLFEATVKKKLRALSRRANYSDRETATCR